MMNKSSIASVTEHIDKITTKWGTGFYCTITPSSSILEIYHVIVTDESTIFQMFGIVQEADTRYLSEVLLDEETIIDFVPLDTILLHQHRERLDNF